MLIFRVNKKLKSVAGVGTINSTVDPKSSIQYCNLRTNIIKAFEFYLVPSLIEL